MKTIEEGVELTQGLKPVDKTLSYRITRLLPALAVIDLILLLGYLNICWGNQLARSPAVNLIGGAIAMIVLILGFILSLVYALFSGDISIGNSLGELLLFGTPALRVILGLAPLTFLLGYYMIRVLKKAYISFEVKLRLTLALLFLAVIFLVAGILAI